MQIYTLLGIQPNATEAEIKKAYRKLAVKYHPDKNFGDKKAQAKFVAINKAYQIALKNVNVVKYNNTSTSQQSSYKSHSHYSYKHTYYDFSQNKKTQQKKKEEFDWDKYYSRYSNDYANQKVKSQKNKATSKNENQYKTQYKTNTQKQTIVVEESSFDASKIVLYLIAGLMGVLIFVLTENLMWSITTSLIVSSLIMLSSLFQQESVGTA